MLRVHIEVALRPEAQPLLAFYSQSVVYGAQRAVALGEEGGPSRYRGRPGLGRPGDSPSAADSMESPAEALLNSADFRSVLRSLERMRSAVERQPLGLLRWLQGSPLHGYCAGAAWFAFCFAGLFPCPLWAVPLYLWLLLAVNAFLASRQRQEEWSKDEGEEPATSLFWDDSLCAEAGFSRSGASSISNFAYVAKIKQTLYAVEPLLLTKVAFGERVRNLLTFADGAASSASFALLFLAALGLSFTMVLLVVMDPSLCFFSGFYGAIGIVSLSKKGSDTAASKAPALWEQWAFNEAFACVPDDAQMAHRYVATKLQSIEV